MDAPPISPSPSHVRLTAGALAEISRRALRLTEAELARIGLSRPLLDSAIHGAKYDDEGGRDAMRRCCDGLDHLGLVLYEVVMTARRAGQVIWSGPKEVRASSGQSAVETAIHELGKAIELNDCEVNATATRIR